MTRKKSKVTETGVHFAHHGQGQPASKSDQAWAVEMGKLQAAMKKLKKNIDADVHLSRLLLSCSITGFETHAQKVKLVKAAIKDAHRNKPQAAVSAFVPSAKLHPRAKSSNVVENTTNMMLTAVAATPVGPEAEWLINIQQLEKTTRKLKQGSGCSVDLSRLPLSHRVTGHETLAEKKRIVKKAITETHAVRDAYLSSNSVAARRDAPINWRNKRRDTDDILEKSIHRPDHEVKNTGESIAARPAHCRQPLPLYAALELQAQAENQAACRKRQQAKQPRTMRQECIDSLSRFFPSEATTAHIVLIGLASHPIASLLGLPEKIQQQIYRHVLVEHGPVQISPSNHQQPGLVRTCQQLRMESLWIFESGNTFSVDVVDSQPVLPTNFATHWAHQVLFGLNFSGKPRWNGMKNWLKAFHEGRAPGLCYQSSDQSKEWIICEKAFQLAKTFRTIIPDITFEEMEPMLEVWKEILSLQQVGWSWDECHPVGA